MTGAERERFKQERKVIVYKNYCGIDWEVGINIGTLLYIK